MDKRQTDGVRKGSMTGRLMTPKVAGAVATATLLLGGVGAAHALEATPIVPQPITVNGNMLFNFMHGPDNAPWYVEWTGSAWTAEQSLGGALIGAPAAASWGSNRVDVFVHGTDVTLYQNAWQGSGFSGWFPLGGGVAGDPVAVSTAFNRYDVLYPNVNGDITDNLWNGSQWLFPTIPAASIGVASRITVIGALGVGWAFWLGNNGALYMSSRESGTTTWTTPRSVANGPFTNNPSAIAWGPQQIPMVFIRTSSGTLAWVQLSGGTWTTNFLGAPGATFQGSPAGVAWNTNHINIFFIGNDGGLWNEYYDGNWHGFSEINSTAVSGPPSVVNWGTANPPQGLTVYMRGPAGRLAEEVWNGSQWNGYFAVGPTIFP